MSELDEARTAIEAYLQDNNLDEEETEFTLSFNHGASSIQGNIETLLSAIEEALEGQGYWRIEIWNQDENSRQIIVTLELIQGGGLWDVTYHYGGQQ